MIHGTLNVDELDPQLSTRLGYRKIGPQTKRRKFHPEQLIRNAESTP